MEKNKIRIKPNLPIKIPVISVIGGPGSGKGTLCQLLAKHYGLFHITIGNLLRDEIKSGSNISQQLTKVLQNGENADVKIVLRILEKKMLENTSHNGYLLDGFPRDAEHGIKFEERIAPICCMLYLQASATTLKKRLLKRAKNSDRIDDNLVTIEKRINIYLMLEKDILKKYASKIRRISCEKPIAEVFNNTITVLNDYLAPKNSEN